MRTWAVSPLKIVPFQPFDDERTSVGAASTSPELNPQKGSFTVKLYYTPGSCSLAPHIVAHELGIELELSRVDLSRKTTEDGGDFTLVNPKGAVPVLVLDSGETLTETAVILTYLCETADREQAGADIDRYRLQEALNFVATELHKTLGLLFTPHIQQQSKDMVLAMLGRRLDFLNHKLEGSDFLVGPYSIADAYAFTVLSWTKFLKIDLARWPFVRSYLSRIAERPKVRETLAAEGLVDAATA